MTDPTRAALAAALDVIVERVRQVDAEGYDPDHDDDLGPSGLLVVACTYLTRAATESPTYDTDQRPARRRIVQAAAVLLAAIEALDRTTPTPTEKEHP